MILALDIGNSNIVIGMYEKEQWTHIWRINSSLEKGELEYGNALRNFFLEADLRFSEVQGVALSSVVPDLSPILRKVLTELCGQKVLVLGPEIYAKLDITIDRPYEIGSDLVCNAFAAYAKFQSAAIVVDFGTALTFTSIGKQGQILGVAIAPGLKTAMYSLFSNTAQLPEVPLELPKSAIGKNTVEALQAGVLLGYVGLAESLIKRIQTELGSEVPVIATGGLSVILEPVKHLFTEIDPQLTLNGLRLIFEKFGS